jgi:thiamine kinase-like enzyme
LQVLSSLRAGPRLFGEFPNGRVEEYFVGSSALHSADMRLPVISRRIATKLYEMHSLIGMIPPVYESTRTPELSASLGSGVAVQCGGRRRPPYRSELWDRLSEWWQQAVSVQPAVRERYGGRAEEFLGLIGGDLRLLETVLADLQQHCSLVESPVVFGHNDVRFIIFIIFIFK